MSRPDGDPAPGAGPGRRRVRLPTLALLLSTPAVVLLAGLALLLATPYLRAGSHVTSAEQALERALTGQKVARLVSHQVRDWLIYPFVEASRRDRAQRQLEDLDAAVGEALGRWAALPGWRQAEEAAVDRIRRQHAALVEVGRNLVAHANLEAGDPGALELAAHSLKGSAANLGAEGLRAAAGRLEVLGRDGDLQEASAALEGVREELEQVVRELGRIRPGGPEG